jgi:hypothetical protein
MSLIERFANKEPVQRIIDAELLAAKLELDISFVQAGKEDGTIKNYIDDLTILRTNYE